MQYKCCLRYFGKGFDKEFFIQKAIGWALREYSKTVANWVKDIVWRETLAPLSVREGLKLMK